MGERRRSREIALQMLFSVDLGQLDCKALKKDYLEDLDDPAEVKNFAFELLEGTVTNLVAIDAAIINRLKNWDFERLANVDKNILRFASFELLYREDIPVPVTINEAIEIAKDYSGKEAGKFINGILDNLKKDIKIKKKE